ncbi:TetR/AcrR family transcriptional regulator [Mycolicibacterium litorale]|uniref:TetR family transcriptional regulator n=1 Tax=Mycolicibacterium litorale TaxID=758802 RepID=A0AAD1IL57_9MYCO|nr:TetR/AcrR family transcriptional regulator [Mycolicibacterium litorale]TDY02076.1 TetR family transcriptional regulator [Mycolicibacterium litorale]BBY15577.1 TetR family transcriptional regulator [Mycolicibacterium litorale]
MGADSALTRRQIVRAGRMVVIERGYSGMTFQAIAERTGLSRPTLHYYFNTREEVYAGVVMEVREVVVDCVAQALRHDRLLDRLSEFVAAVRRVDARDPSLVPFLISARLEPQRNPELWAISDSPVRAFLNRLVSDAIQRGELDADTDIEGVADLLQVILYGLAFYSGFTDGPAGLSAIVTPLIELFAHGLVTAPQGLEPAGGGARGDAAEDTHHDTPKGVGGRS